MPGLAAVAREFARERPFAGCAVLLNMHPTAETQRLGEALDRGGATVAYLDSSGAAGRSGATGAVAGRMLQSPDQLATAPWLRGLPLLVVEGNGAVFERLHDACRPAPAGEVIGISEHTSGGGRLVDAFEAGGNRPAAAVVAVYRSALKTRLETGLGTSQSAAAALLRSLGGPVAGRQVAVVGFGHVGSGLARLLRSLGARLVVVETRAEALLAARLEGFETAPLAKALEIAAIVLTCTGTSRVLTADRLERGREGQLLANLSNRRDEIDLTGCELTGRITAHLACWKTPTGRTFRLLGEGIQLNHAVGGGNPAELMDLSFTLHALVLRWLCREWPPPAIYSPPPALAEEAARLVLEAAP